jgi:hypothetical protein
MKRLKAEKHAQTQGSSQTLRTSTVGFDQAPKPFRKMANNLLLYLYAEMFISLAKEKTKMSFFMIMML